MEILTCEESLGVLLDNQSLYEPALIEAVELHKMFSSRLSINVKDSAV
jgi:hypothetical protein